MALSTRKIVKHFQSRFPAPDSRVHYSDTKDKFVAVVPEVEASEELSLQLALYNLQFRVWYAAHKYYAEEYTTVTRPSESHHLYDPKNPEPIQAETWIWPDYRIMYPAPPEVLIDIVKDSGQPNVAVPAGYLESKFETTEHLQIFLYRIHHTENIKTIYPNKLSPNPMLRKYYFFSPQLP